MKKIIVIFSVLLLNATLWAGQKNLRLMTMMQTNANTSCINAGGIITEDTVWIADTVFVTDRLTIASNATLTIKPGVKIIVSHRVPIIVDGAISAVGTEDSYIEFTTRDTSGIHNYDQTTGGWAGIEYPENEHQAKPSNYEYCRFSYAKAYDDDDDDEVYEKGAAVFVSDANQISFNHCTFEDNVAYHSAGAIYANGVNIEINNCAFNRNYGYRWFGGAIYVQNMTKAAINNSHFEGNKAGKGGAIYSLDVDSVFVDNCVFQYNEATRLTTAIMDNLGAALAMERWLKYGPMFCEFTNSVVQNSRCTRGGLFFDSDITAVIKNNNLSYNWSYNPGAAIDVEENVRLSVANNIFTNNEAHSGAAIDAKKVSKMELVNNLFANNYGTDDYASSSGYGGGAVIVHDGGAPVLIANNTFSHNRHNYMGGALHLNHCSNTSVVNNIFYNNTAPRAPQIIVNTKGAADPSAYCPDMTHNLIEDGLDSLGFYTGYGVTEYFEDYSGTYENNLNADPGFVQISAGTGTGFDGQEADWTLQSSSPCINAGNESIPLDSLGTNLDLAGNPRIYLEGDVQIIDLGSYEFQGNPTRINDASPGPAVTFNLKQNYPNPFNPKTTISYKLPVANEIELSIYNVLGQKVKTLVNQKQNAGTYSVQLDAGNLTSGVYFYRLTVGENRQSRRMILMR